jgi:hypothetical protein
MQPIKAVDGHEDDNDTKIINYNSNQNIMKFLRLLTLATLMTATLIAPSCNKDNIEGPDVVSKENLMSGGQETPAVPTTATGTVFSEYNKKTRILTYRVTWSGLTAPVAAMHIHGLADPGTAAPIVQNIITASGGLATPSASRYGTSGSFSGSLLVDGVVIKEQELLNGKFYMNIHTSTYPAGEIRGQMLF